jgi:uncharacterized protein (TIGR03437 family)
MTSGWLTVSPTSGSGTTKLVLSAVSNGLANGVYRAVLGIEASGVVPQVIQVPVTMVIGAGTGMSIAGVVDNASGSLSLAPGMQAAVYGTSLSLATRSASAVPLPFSMAGVSATVNGVSAPLYYVSPGQINLQIPYETGAGPAALAIRNSGQVAEFDLQVSAAAPGIYGGMLNAKTGAYNTGSPGDVMTLYLTGAGDVTPTAASGAAPPAGTSLANLPQPRMPVSVMVGGEAATVSFAGIPAGLVGVMQVNFTIPIDVAAGSLPVMATVGGTASAPVNIEIVQAAR